MTIHEEETRSFIAMASRVDVRLVDPTSTGREALDAVEALFQAVQAQCSRFDPTSSLSRANATLGQWVDVDPFCELALHAALRAHRETGGMFDPRILNALLRQGYTHSLPFDTGNVQVEGRGPARGRLERKRDGMHRPWKPKFAGGKARIGRVPVDLGGIGKGLAVQWAMAKLVGHGSGALIDAGGDVSAHGLSQDGGPWRIGVENPWDPSGDPVAVIGLQDSSIATSSIRLRQWRQGDHQVHHLIDPRTGHPGGIGLMAVTVVGKDASWAEVWSKSLFLEGRVNIGKAARERQLAAMWIDVNGRVQCSPAMSEHVLWKESRAEQP